MVVVILMLDDVIKEYFVFWGFLNILKSFELDLKVDKDKSFRVSCFIVVCVVII